MEESVGPFWYQYLIDLSRQAKNKFSTDQGKGQANAVHFCVTYT